ncbi:uncharacterized protein LOC143028628 [Oratosquilla oratoria]|uniref:uncharacterized protein LOC143028628 n=1 Tax=Oratosquilla oratoria TaxID=337810 RepID=UPI003F7599A7
MKKKSTDVEFLELYITEEEGNQPCHHTLLHLPRLESLTRGHDMEGEDTYNLLMADVSASMYLSWRLLVSGWNNHVAPYLRGRTEVYVFDDVVKLVRKNGFLSEADFKGGMTDLHQAFSTIMHCITTCREKNTRIFFITDGEHTVPQGNPKAVLEQMATPEGKRCEVFIWGTGTSFPVRHSLDIQWRLHNGNANMPTLFWSKKPQDIEEVAEDIGTYLVGSSGLVTLSHPGCLVPGLPERLEFHRGEWIYMQCDPDTLGSLSVSTNKGMITPCQHECRQFTMDLFLDDVLPQWNSQLIQMHKLKKPLPDEIFLLIERIFESLVHLMPAGDLKTVEGRLSWRKAKEARVWFQTFTNQIKALLTKEKFVDEMELAETILLTTVTTRKHFIRGLKLGHMEQDYAEDCRVFMHAYNHIREKLKTLDVEQKDCCCITLSSTISDLRDERFPELMKFNKFEFLKTFTISGLPVFCFRDSAELNPWSFKIDRILTSPFGILSQVALEEYASFIANAMGQEDKEVHLQQGLDVSSCNAVVPIFPAAMAKVMKPLVHTNFYAMCTTFALLKNPDIVDDRIHMGGLAAVWVKTLLDHPMASQRPKFIRERLENIVSTATLYLDLPRFATYLKVLLTDPPRALMKECPQRYPEEEHIKCESLLKPLFLLYMGQRTGCQVRHQLKINIVRLAAVEFLGRCLPHSAVDKFPFTACFMQGMGEERNRKEWLHGKLQEFSKNILASKGNLVGRFYFPELIKKYVFRLLKEKQEVLNEVLKSAVDPRVTGIEKLGSIHNCGDVTWSSLQTCSIELGLSKEEVKYIFSDNNTFIFMFHALTHTSSVKRMSVPTSDYNTCLNKVKTEILKELKYCVREVVLEAVLRQWQEEYDACHSVLVRPMTQTQLIGEAIMKGIDVTKETFDQVYPHYSKELGLLRNACQSARCPFYLQPRRSFSQHVAAGRQPGKFCHCLHKVASGEGDISIKVEFLKSFNHETVATNPDIFEVCQRSVETLSLMYQQYILVSNN